MKKGDAKNLLMPVNHGSPVYGMGLDMGTELWFLWQFETRTLLHEHEVGAPLSETGIDIDINQPRKIFTICSFLALGFCI